MLFCCLLANSKIPVEDIHDYYMQWLILSLDSIFIFYCCMHNISLFHFKDYEYEQRPGCKRDNKSYWKTVYVLVFTHSTWHLCFNRKKWPPMTFYSFIYSRNKQNIQHHWYKLKKIWQHLHLQFVKSSRRGWFLEDLLLICPGLTQMCSRASW